MSESCDFSFNVFASLYRAKMLRLDNLLSLHRHEQLGYFEYISEPLLCYFYLSKEAKSILLYFHKYLYSCLHALLFQE